MTRDETVALFEACEARRADARAAGKDQAHEAAKAHWNAWARKRLAEKKALEDAGRWDTEKENWGRASVADFSRCRFLLKGG